MTMVLEGIRIVDWSAVYAGPMASMMLGDLGAEVIKIEQRVTGDSIRGLVGMGGRSFEMPGGRNANIEAYNRNKRSITLDVTKDKGREIMYRLIEQADIFVHNFRQGVPDRLGLGYETLSHLNPRLIYASISPWGPNGPDTEQAGYDFLAQARSGFMTSLGEPDMPPLLAAIPIADQLSGTIMAYGILAALIARERTGLGQRVDVSLLGSMLWMEYLSISTSLMVGFEMPRQSRAEMYNPLYCHYRCADGQWIALGMLQSDRYWPDFCELMGLVELKKNPRFENMMVRALNCKELIVILDRLFAKKTSAEWVQILERSNMLFSRVNSIPELASDAQVKANDYIIEYEHSALGKINMVGMPVQLSRTPGLVRRPAPEFGEHTEEVLLELGYSWNDITQLRKEEVV